jgi:MGT family glycosyltransferase
MRVLFTSSPDTGHLHPLVPIARAMVDAGHEVAFATPAPFAPTVERSGFRVFPAGMTKTIAEAFPEHLALRGRAETEFMLRCVRPAQAAAMVRGLQGVMAGWRPDLLVREGSEFGGCIAARHAGIPYAVVEVLATGFGEDRRSFLSAGLAGLLAEYGLPPDPELGMLDRQLVLSPFPPSYRQADDQEVASLRHAIRPTPFDQSGEERLPAWAAELAARPIVYLTLGTVPQFNARPKVFRAFIEGLADEPLNLIIAVGRNNDPAEFGPAPPNVRIERYIPQTLVFPRCDLVVCHAGSGTVMAALVHGLPLVLTPFAADQPENARRCAALGLARVISDDAVDPSVARAAVLDVLGAPTYRRNAERLRADIEALPGPEHAVWLLEGLVSQLASALGAP